MLARRRAPGNAAAEQQHGTLGSAHHLRYDRHVASRFAGRRNAVLSRKSIRQRNSRIDARALNVQRNLDEDRPLAARPSTLDQSGYGSARHGIVEAHRCNGDRAYDRHAVDFLNPPLANAAAREVAALHLAADDQQLAAFEKRARDRRDDIRQARAGRHHRERAARGRRGFVERFHRHARRDFVNERHARKARSSGIEEMHDISARYEEAVRIPQLAQPIGEQLGVLHYQTGLKKDSPVGSVQRCIAAEATRTRPRFLGKLIRHHVWKFISVQVIALRGGQAGPFDFGAV